MRYLNLIILSGFLFLNNGWETDFEKAKQTARSEHKNILLNFSGSDWCIPCINLRKDVFESNIFEKFAEDHLILVNADFPRLKKHKLSSEQQSKNDQLADLYNKEGIFPLTILLSPEGRVLKKWEGLPHISASEFTDELKSLDHASN
jgi:thioredoxin-related protein